MKITERRRIGRTGVDVSLLGLGTAPLGGLYRPTPEVEAEATLDAALERGIGYFDTAPMYGRGKAEHILGRAVRTRRRSGSVTVSTKAGRLLRAGRPGERDAGPSNAFDSGWHQPLPFREVFDYSYDGIMRSVEDSQQRLGFATLDMLAVHDIGRLTHGDRHDVHWTALTRGGGFDALGELRSAGVVGAVGVGVNELDIVGDALAAFDLDYAMLAGRYTLLEQAPLDGLFDACAARGVSVVVAAPFNSGILAAARSGERKFDYRDAPAEIVAKADALDRICASFAVPLAQAAIQFPLAHPAVACVVAGMRTPGEVAAAVAWVEAETPPELWMALKTAGLIDRRAPVPFHG